MFPHPRLFSIIEIGLLGFDVPSRFNEALLNSHSLGSAQLLAKPSSALWYSSR
jgi:hypothetical protein